MVVLWLGLSSLSSVSKHNSGRIILGFVVRCSHSVNTICCRIMAGFLVVVVRQKSTIRGRIMDGFVGVVVSQ